MKLVLEKMFRIAWVSFKWIGTAVLMLFVIDFLVSSMASGCINGALSYSGCTISGRDVSVFLTNLAWLTIAGFVLLGFVAAFATLVMGVQYFYSKSKI